MSVIGGADGPTAVFVSADLPLLTIVGAAVVVVLFVVILSIFKRK